MGLIHYEPETRALSGKSTGCIKISESKLELWNGAYYAQEVDTSL